MKPTPHPQTFADWENRECRPDRNPPELWFKGPGTEATRAAKAACLHCPIYWQCQEYALSHGVPEGVYGGLHGDDRDRIWKRWDGGKPTHFLDAIDENFSRLFMERRDRERKTA